ncbi:hypothetical protein EDD15DRAFT_2533127 [Pisolithus albus]|nr:hypothetical protein EDD15DRAFT_2533127 [Pisolithus albus]
MDRPTPSASQISVARNTHAGTHHLAWTNTQYNHWGGHVRGASVFPSHPCLVMADVSTALKWGPGFVGMSIGLAMYGVSIRQYLFYTMAFPRDKRLVKYVALLVFVLDTVNTLTCLSFYCRTLILCRWKTSYTCTLQLPWDLSTNLVSRFTVSFLVQCFYAHRVWMICGRSKLLTSTALFVALAALVFGYCYEICIPLVTTETFSTPRYVVVCYKYESHCVTPCMGQYSLVYALASTICDGLITTSIYISLRRSRSGLLRRLPIQSRKENCITKLDVIFVHMGMITFLTTITMCILSFQSQPVGEFLLAAPGFMLSKGLLPICCTFAVC